MDYTRITGSHPGRFLICVDQICGQDWGGRAYHWLSAQPMVFCQLSGLVLDMDTLMDQAGYPEPTVCSRKFLDGPAETVYVPSEQPETVSFEGGAQATFRVEVRQRQNASWQGEVTWLDRDKAQCFSSALELMKLLDGALCQKKR